MSEWAEKVAAREALWYRQANAMIAATYPAQSRAASTGWRSGFREGWGVSREVLLSDETVERAAHGIHASHDRGDWDEELPVVQDEYLDMARAALAAALGEDENDE